MVAFLPFEPAHLTGLHLQSAQAYLQPLLADPKYGEVLKVPGLAWSGEVAGDLMGSAGVLPQWPGRALVWALFGHSIPRRAWPSITQYVEKVLDDAHAAGHRRLEAIVDPNFAAAIRWVSRLGFKLETPEPMAGYAPNGAAFYQFARVRL